jgi:anthranilate synthase component 1
MIFFDKKKFIEIYKKNIPQILSSHFIADTDTPISALLKISNDQKYSFLLESVEGGDQRGRYSLLGCDPDLIWKVKDGKVSIKTDSQLLKNKLDLNLNPIKSLKNIINQSKIYKNPKEPPYPVLVGYLGYPMIQYMEKIKLNNSDPIKIPEAIMIRPKIAAVFDNIKDTINVMTTVYPEKEIKAEEAFQIAEDRIKKNINKLNSQILKNKIPNRKLLENNIDIKSNFKKEEYLNIVKKAKKYICDGDIFQVVPSQRFECKYFLNAKSLYRSLRRLNPSPFLVNLNFEDFGLVASSPEILVRVREGKITIRPIAGTRKRGETTKEDIKLSNDLISDQKELAEHLMLLDLGRNDVGRVAKIGTVKVTEKMIIEYYSHVMHIVSNVEGQLDKQYDSVDALVSGFPAGTVSGAPKIRAMEIIEELENVNRSFYGGAMGYFDSNGQMDTCISLRTGLVKKNKLYIQAGGGVVYDSDPEKEFQETINKAKAIIKAAEDSYNYPSL